MISFEPFWRIMKEKGFSTYTLRNIYGIGGGTVQRLQKNQSISTNTINDLCKLLDCNVEDVIEYKEDD
ncbi:MAG: helix-turn-helix transcriptional regulator [Oscillospiraceae bacterium]|nr:helix-turn-helix transcriptional regulator [Oscillospiraceae bacterium]